MLRDFKVIFVHIFNNLFFRKMKTSNTHIILFTIIQIIVVALFLLFVR